MEVGGNHMEVGGNHMRRLHYACPLVAMIAVLLTLGACSSNSTHAASHEQRHKARSSTRRSRGHFHRHGEARRL